MASPASGGSPATPTGGGGSPARSDSGVSAASGQAEFLLHGVRGEAAFWRVSALLSESAIGCAGVDVVMCKDDVRVAVDGTAEGGALVAVRVRAGSDVLKELPWSRADDNELRGLQALRADVGRALTDAEEARLADLAPRFEEFLRQGVKAIDDRSITLFVGWLPYTLIMSVNPGLLSKKARKAVEAAACLPLVTGGANAPTEEPIPAPWRSAFLLPTTHLLGVRCTGSLFAAKGLQFYFTRQAPPPAVVHDSVDLAHFTCDRSLCVTDVTVSPRSVCPVAVGDLLVAIDGDVADARYARAKAAGGTHTVQVVPTQCTELLTLPGGGAASALLKVLDAHGVTLRKALKNDGISWVVNGVATAPH